MKKKLLAVFTGIILILTTLSGCSCSSKSVLEFNKNFYGTQTNTPTSYKEVCEYKITLDSSNVQENIKNNLPEIEGKMITTFESSIKIKEELNTLLKDTHSNLISDSTSNIAIYKFTTDFNVSAKHKCIINDKEFNDDNTPNVNYNPDGINYDSIKTVVYFFSQDSGFAPIYTTTSYNYTSFAITENNSASVVTYGKCSTLYQKDSYTLTEAYAYTLEDVEKEEYKNTKTINYTYKTLIDNAQLLFAIRNIDVLEDSNAYIPVVSYQYDEAKDLVFMNLGSSATAPDFKVDYKLNDTENEYSKSVFKAVSFKINSQYNSGSLQTVYIQEKEADENITENSLPYNALLFQYEKPLLEYSSNASIGSLLHTLTKVEVTKQ